MSKLMKCMIAFAMLIGISGCSKKQSETSKKEESVKTVTEVKEEDENDEESAEIQEEDPDPVSENSEKKEDGQVTNITSNQNSSSLNNSNSSNVKTEQNSNSSKKTDESKQNSTVSTVVNDQASAKTSQSNTSVKKTEISQNQESKENTEAVVISQSEPATEVQPTITPVSNNTDGSADVDQTTVTWGTAGFKAAAALSEAVDTNYLNNTIGGLDICIQLGEDDTCGLNGPVTFTLKGIRQALGNTETFGSKEYTIASGDSHVVIEGIPAGSYQIIVTSWPSQNTPNPYFYQVVNGNFTLNNVDTSSYIRDGNTNRKVWLVFD